jgi:glutamate/tyrosine decarboxylase-like PLP-dependent enzyme
MDSSRATSLPKQGSSWEGLREQLKAFKALDYDWRKGRLSAYTYYYDEELLRVQREAYSAYMVENALGLGRVFGSLAKMQNEIFDMAYGLFNAPQTAGASFTSGGTESIFEIVKTARTRARAVGSTDTRKHNIVAPYTAHPALNKAAMLLDLEVRRVALQSNYRADVKAMANATDENTILIFASAPCFPYGVFDPISEIASFAESHSIWMHVDGCFGGFISPFAKILGYPIPEWDFRIPGVTSLSADLHKYGFAVKGASLAIFRDKALQKYEQFEFGGWPRGTYATPTFAGSKPAGSIAAAWAVMRYLGEEGYVRTTKASMDATMQFIDGINAIPGLKCLEPNGETPLYLFSSTDPSVDIMAVADRLKSQGWYPGRMREPLAIAQAVNPVHLKFVDEFLSDVRQAVKATRESRVAGKFDERTY